MQDSATCTIKPTIFVYFQVSQFINQWPFIQSAQEVIQAPGVVQMKTRHPIDMGQAVRSRGKQRQCTVFGGGRKSVYICGLCLRYWSGDLQNVKNIHKCDTRLDLTETEKLERKREKERVKKKAQRKKRKEEAALNDEVPPPKRSKTTHSAPRRDHTNEIHDPPPPMPQPPPVEDETDAVEKICGPPRHVEVVEHFGGLDELNVIKTYDLQIKVLREATYSAGKYLYSQWKPDMCPAYSDESQCQIQCHGYTERWRFLDIPLPAKLNVPDYHCAIHRKYFTAVPLLRSLEKEALVEPDIVVRKGKSVYCHPSNTIIVNNNYAIYILSITCFPYSALF